MTAPKNPIKYPTQIEPWIWLQEDEQEGHADCGCTLSLDDGAKLNFCTMHAAAEELLGLLAEVLQHSSPAWTTASHEKWEAAHALVRKARGAKQ